MKEIVILLVSLLILKSQANFFSLISHTGPQATFVKFLENRDVINVDFITSIQVEFIPGKSAKEIEFKNVQGKPRFSQRFNEIPDYEESFRDRNSPFYVFVSERETYQPLAIQRLFQVNSLTDYTFQTQAPGGKIITNFFAANSPLLCQLTQSRIANGIVCLNGGVCQAEQVGNSCFCRVGFAQPDCATCQPGFTLVGGNCIIPFRGPCENYPLTDLECAGNGYIAPNHMTALYSSNDQGNTVTLRWDLDNNACNAPDRRFGSAVTLKSSTYLEKLDASNQEFVSKSFDTLDESLYSWSTFSECWRRAKKDFIVSDPTYNPASFQPTGFSFSTDRCWVRDKITRSDADQCFRSFVYCRRQGSSQLEAPPTNSLFKSVSTITFRWSAVTFREPECAKQLSDFKYVFTIWFNSNSSVLFNLTTPNTEVSVNGKIFSEGVYRWSVSNYRIVPSNKVVEGSSSVSIRDYVAPRLFQYCLDDLAPSVPVLLSPTSNTLVKSTSNTPDGVSISFSWSISNFGRTCSPGSNLFVLFISSQSDMSNSREAKIIGTQTTFTGSLPAGKWYWYIMASNGVLQSQSTVSSFSVCVLAQPSEFSNTLPTNGANGISFLNINFQWQPSSPRTSCATIAMNYQMFLKNGTHEEMRYEGTGTSTTISTTPGVYQWYVVARDSEGQTRRSGETSFLTVSSICSDIPPSPTTISNPSYQWNGTSLLALLSWSEPSLGIACNPTKRATPYFSLSIFDSSNSLISQFTLGIEIREINVTLDAGKYTWNLETYNEGGAKSTSGTGSIEFCETNGFASFASNLLPLNNSVITDSSLTSVSWNFIGSPNYSCLGSGITYSILIEGDSNIFSPFTESTTSFDVSNLQPGSWRWTIRNDLSSIPIRGLSSISYSHVFHKCIPGAPLSPVNISPSPFSRNIGGKVEISWSHDRGLTDSCSVLLSKSLVDVRYRYELFTSRSSSYTNSTSQCTFELESQDFTNETLTRYNCSIDGLSAGLNYWKARVTKETIVSSKVVSSFVKESSSSLFSVCIDTPPIVPQLVFPPEGTVYERCNITTKFKWNPISNSEFGIFCGGQNSPTIKIYIGLDPLNPNDKVVEALSFVSETEPISLIEEIFVPNATYYWYLEASGSLLSTRSEIRSFVVPNRNLAACSGNGKCTFDGLCSCSDTHFGSLCENRYPDPTDPPTEPPTVPSDPVKDSNQTPIIIGVLVALAFLVILGIVAFLFIKRKFRIVQEKRNPPDFVHLAFNPPEGYPPLETAKLVPWYSFEQLLLSNNFLLAKAIMDATQATEIDDVAKCLVYVIESRSKGCSFVKELISKDIKEKREAKTLNSTTLFRDNSHASKAFKTYSKIVALGYLYLTLGEFVYEYVKSNKTQQEEVKEQEKEENHPRRKSTASSNSIELTQVVIKRSNSTQTGLFAQGSVEVDPTKMTDEEDVLANSILLQLHAQKIVLAVFRSTKIFPPNLADILHHLMSEVETNLTREDGYNSFAAFTFLRLVNPSLLFPYQYGLVDQPPNDDAITRQFILISKVLQNLANGVHFGVKEQHMVPMNDFIDSNRNNLRNFIDNILNQTQQVKKDRTKSFELKQTTQSKLGLKRMKSEEEEQMIFPSSNFEEIVLQPLEVPRNVVEKSLSFLYSHFHKTRDRVMTSLDKYGSSEEVKITINKCQAIFTEIGEPPQKDQNLKKNDKH